MTTNHGRAGLDRRAELRAAAPEDDVVNVGRTERVVSAFAGLALGLYGLRRKRLRSVLLPVAGSLVGRAVTGRCPVNRALGRNTARAAGRSSQATSVQPGRGIRVEEAVTITRPRQEVYRFWRNLENLPRFMDHLESVRVMDESLSHWVAKGPAGARVEWDAEIHNEVPNELIAWRSLPGSAVDHAGSVRFVPGPNDGTEVRVLLRYDLPAGRPGALLARLFGEEPSRQVGEDLRRLKQVIEAGEHTSSGPA